MAVSFGEQIRLEIYGQSHGPCIGVIIDGLPAGRRIDLDKLQAFLDRRAPGRNAWSTSRKEADRPRFLSGVTEDSGEARTLTTTGERLEAVIDNTNIRPRDYANSSVIPRPGHADYPAWVKYGEIASGGGQFSARLTAALCIAGGIFLQWLAEEGVHLRTHIRSIGNLEDLLLEEASASISSQVAPGTSIDLQLPEVDPEFPVLDDARAEAMKDLIARVKEAGDSIGGRVECGIYGVPAGLGSPLFGSIESRICQVVFAVPAVKGIEFGSGFDVARMLGSENNDPYEIVDGKVKTRTNHHGGILGGLSSGMPIIFTCAMKPTPSIGQPQCSVDLKSMQSADLTIKGRHDPCIVPRAVPCIEAAAAIAIADIFMEEGIWT